MKLSRIWEILNSFKRFCRSRGWRISESEDWVKVNDDYHNFLWTRDVNLSSFKRIVTNRKCVVREGLSYRVVDASYTAWLFSKSPSEDLLKIFFEDPDYSKRVAIYDLSPLLTGKNSCSRFNNTGSQVFQEFENFLQNEFNVKVESFFDSPRRKYKVSEIA